jgi:hypothetical protein
MGRHIQELSSLGNCPKGLFPFFDACHFYPQPFSTRSRMIWEALKLTTRRAEMVASTPVFGFRPIRGRLALTLKLPNRASFTN